MIESNSSVASDAIFMDGRMKTAPKRFTLIKPKDSRPPWYRSRTVRICAPLIPWLFLIGMIPGLLLATAHSIPYDVYYGCDPNGDIWMANYGHDPTGDIWVSNYGLGYQWGLTATKYTLAVSFGFGKMSFAAAKAIDILWDFVVGFGIQAVGATIIYRVFRKAMLRKTEHYAAPFDSVLSMQYNTVSSQALCSYLKSTCRRPLRHLFTNITLAIATSYVLALPIWLSAMTAYQPIAEPMAPQGNGLVPMSSFTRCYFFIDDGDRIGLGGPTCIKGHPETDLFISIDHYTDVYGFSYSARYDTSYGRRNTSSTFISPSNQTFHLDPPLLNISYNMFAYEHKAYSAQFLASYGVCAPQKAYKWGFSFNLLFAFLLASTVVWLCVYIVWIRCTFQVDGEQTSKYFGSLRTALEVAIAIREQLGEQVIDMSNDGLKQEARLRKAGLRFDESISRAELEKEIAAWKTERHAYSES